MKVFFLRHHWLLAIFSIVFVTNFLEIILLQKKYELFTGGFLTAFSFSSWGDRLTFLLFSVYFDFIFFGLIAAIWRKITFKLNKPSVLHAFYYTISITFVVTIIFTTRYKLLSYFSDTINLTIIKNLGGGSLKEALLYSSQELIFAFIFLCIAIIFTFFLAYIIRRIPFIKTSINKAQDLPANRNSKIYLWIFILSTPFISWYVSSYDNLNYAFKKKFSYSTISKFFNIATDFDLDGYGVIVSPRDSKPFNNTIFPGAVDIPGNGIDENELLGDALVTTKFPDILQQVRPTIKKHILFIVLESTRSDILNQKHKGKAVAPNIKNIAQNGTSFPYAYSHTGYTTTSLRAMFNRSLLDNSNQTHLLPFLAQNGYNISVLSAQDESFGQVAHSVGFDRYTSKYFDARTAIEDRVFPSKEPGSLRLSEKRLVKEFKSHIETIDLNQPQFMYINIQAAHFPYFNKEMDNFLKIVPIPRSSINQKNKKWVEKTYWNAIASADWAVGEMVNTFKSKLSDKDDVVVVLLGDHGESLFDNGFLGHGFKANDTQTKIPLIFSNQFTHPNFAIGQTDVANYLVRSAIDPSLAIPKRPVFQVIGSLAKPVLISHIEGKGIRTTFDIRTQYVYYEDKKKWVSLEKINDQEAKRRVQDLISDWENIRYLEAENATSHLLKPSEEK